MTNNKYFQSVVSVQLRAGGDVLAAGGTHPHDGEHLPDPGHHAREVHYGLPPLVQGETCIIRGIRGIYHVKPK